MYTSHKMRFCASVVAIVFISALVFAQKEKAACQSVQLTAKLQAGEKFARNIGNGLAFQLEPTRLGPKGDIDGWEISIVDADPAHTDYIYPVNPPLRFNGLQILGASYDDDTKTSLSHAHEMWFLLNKADHDRISPALEHALWPYSAPNPDSTIEEYSAVLNGLTLGRLKVKPVSYDIDAETGAIRRIDLRIELIAPMAFAFNSELKPKSASCPSVSE